MNTDENRRFGIRRARLPSPACGTSAKSTPVIPCALQHEVLLRRHGTLGDNPREVPGLRRIASRCAAPGMTSFFGFAQVLHAGEGDAVPTSRDCGDARREAPERKPGNRIAACAIALLATAACATGAPVGRLDSVPDRYWSIVEKRAALAAAGAPEHTGIVDAVWKKNPVTVAFKGGDAKVHKIIEATANEWTKHGVVKLSFRKPNGTFRTWSASDTARAADIRISFDEPGYWSLIGSFALAEDPNIATMNFEGFLQDLKPFLNRPQSNEWKKSYYHATILHEFGHALGLSHEHFHAACQADMKFPADQGYVETRRNGEYLADAAGRSPGVILYFKGSPNFWKEKDTRLQMERAVYIARATQFANSIGAVSGPLSITESAAMDQKSVMLYSLPEYLFRSGASSPCVAKGAGKLPDGARFGAALSPGDIAYFKEFYE